MEPMSTLISAAKAASALNAFVVQGELANLMGDTSLAAARSALSKSMIAKDPRSQVWSAINHLEAAHEGFVRVYRGKGKFYDSFASRVKYATAIRDDRWTLCLMAICYTFLGEKVLARQALEQARSADEDKLPTPWIMNFTMATQLLDPRLWINMKSGLGVNVSSDELTELDNALSTSDA